MAQTDPARSAKPRGLFFGAVTALTGLTLGLLAIVPSDAAPAGPLEETFDNFGAPSHPSPFVSDRWTLAHGGNVGTGWMAGHDPACAGDGLHHSVSDFYICNQHLMTYVDAGLDLATFTTKQLFDFDNRTGTLSFDTNLYSYGRSWWDVWIIPEASNKPKFRKNEEGGGFDDLPLYGINFSFIAGELRVHQYRNGQRVFTAKDTWLREAGCHCLADEPNRGDPKERFTFRIQVSETGWRWQIASKRLPGVWWDVGYRPDGSSYTSHAWAQPLGFDAGLLKIQHLSYNPSKEEPVSAGGVRQEHRTYHWDNIRFDGPTTSEVTPSATNTQVSPSITPTMTPTPVPFTATPTPSPIPTATTQPNTSTPISSATPSSTAVPSSTPVPPSPTTTSTTLPSPTSTPTPTEDVCEASLEILKNGTPVTGTVWTIPCEL